MTLNYEPEVRNVKGQFIKGPRTSRHRDGYKRCVGACKQVKPFSAFGYCKPVTPHSIPLRPRCRECRKIDSAKDYIARKDFIDKQQIEKYHTQTPEERAKDNAYHREYRKKNPAKYKAWSKQQRIRSRIPRLEAGMRRRHKLAGAICDGHTLAELHQYWRDRDIDPKRCTYCDAWYRRWKNNWKTSSGDHVIPINKGGSHTMDNLVPACLSCNTSKGDRLLHTEWTPPNMKETAWV
jgi:5-methylcytosine-specific restriction endonuclease McrA